VLPQNATRNGTIAACRRSLKRLNTDYLDLYLLHWRQSEPLEETLEAFVALQQAGSIRAYGVSNFDRADLEEAAVLDGGAAVATDQVLYNLEHRGIEWDLLPWCRERALPVMAYSPLGSSGQEQHRLLGDRTLGAVAARHTATAAQIALAWILRQPDVFVIPKAGSVEHVLENRRSLEIELTESDAMERPEQVVPVLRQLRERHIRIAIDDFGTGYSSLAYLKSLPVDTVKIDRSFVQGLPSDPDDAPIARAIVAMAHTLGLKVIAEGVEHDGQRAFLRDLGCDELQGFLYATPLSAEQCGRFLAAAAERRAAVV